MNATPMLTVLATNTGHRSPEIVKGSGMYQLACGGWSNSPLFVLNFNKKEKRLVEQFEGDCNKMRD